MNANTLTRPPFSCQLNRLTHLLSLLIWPEDLSCCVQQRTSCATCRASPTQVGQSFREYRNDGALAIETCAHLMNGRIALVKRKQAKQASESVRDEHKRGPDNPERSILLRVNNVLPAMLL